MQSLSINHDTINFNQYRSISLRNIVILCMDYYLIKLLVVSSKPCITVIYWVKYEYL